MKRAIKESERSELVREELRKRGWEIIWTAQEERTRFSYCLNSMSGGKSLLLMEHAVGMSWQGWDIYVQLTPENDVAKTYSALEAFTQQGVGA